MKYSIRILFFIILCSLCFESCTKKEKNQTTPVNKEDIQDDTSDDDINDDINDNINDNINDSIKNSIRKNTVHIIIENMKLDYVPNLSTIEKKKAKILKMINNKGYVDIELKHKDPNAYWLMGCMMKMSKAVETSDDGLAWMLAMNKCIKKYTNRAGYSIMSIDTVRRAIYQLLEDYCTGSMTQMATVNYVDSKLTYYETIYNYFYFMESINTKQKDWDAKLKTLYYREFQDWFNMTYAAQYLKNNYTYEAIGTVYSVLESHGVFIDWVDARLVELVIERTIYDGKIFKSDAKIVSCQKFDELVKYFESDKVKKDVISTVPEDYLDRFDFKKIKQMAHQYKTSLTDWRKTREQIALMFSNNQQQSSYREITKQMHTRLYNDLLGLKEVGY